MRPEGRRLDWSFDPLEALQRWPVDRRAMLLHSGRYHPRWARWSILASPAGTYRFLGRASQQVRRTREAVQGGFSQWLGSGWPCPVDRFTHKPFADLRALLDRGEGIWVGYLSYDLGRWVERLPLGPAVARDDRFWPIVELGYCPGYLVHDRLTGDWTACGAWADRDTRGDGAMPVLAEHPNEPVSVTASGLHSQFEPLAYEDCVLAAKQLIAAGDVFQVNLAQRFTAALSSQPRLAPGDLRLGRALYGQLAGVSPAWYGAYLEMACTASDQSLCRGGPPQRVLMSTSPELFLEVDAQRVVTRPVKGTLSASADPDQLHNSDKDVAELNMIVDLMRNDLGRVCDYGSVRVTQSRTIESHPTVHHGVAMIEGRLHPTKTIIDLLRATVPAGSVTGAPKVRAMQIIDQIEPVRRGPYCGCIGYLCRDQASLSVGIRTMLADLTAGQIDFSVGGAVVADSQPALEYQETLDKAAAVMSALGVGVSQVVC